MRDDDLEVLEILYLWRHSASAGRTANYIGENCAPGHISEYQQWARRVLRRLQRYGYAHLTKVSTRRFLWAITPEGVKKYEEIFGNG